MRYHDFVKIRRMSSRALFTVAFLVATLTNSSIRSQTVNIGAAQLTLSVDCDTGYAFKFSNADACVWKKSKIKKQLAPLVDHYVKFAYIVEGSASIHDRPFIWVDIVRLNPPQDSGSSYEKRHPVAGFFNTLGAVGNAMNGVPPEASAQPSYSSPTAATAQSTSNDYANGLNECVTAQYMTEGGVQIYSYKNVCSQKISLRFLAIDGTGGAMDLLPSQIQGTGDEPSKMVHRTYDIYACPADYVAVDPNGAWFNAPVTRYKCKKR
jgi:hypothetical protein